MSLKLAMNEITKRCCKATKEEMLVCEVSKEHGRKNAGCHCISDQFTRSTFR